MVRFLNNDIDAIDLNNFNLFDLTNNLLYTSAYSSLFEELNLSCSYFTENEINTEMNKINSDYISCFSLNTQSINSKFDELKTFLSNICTGNSKVDIFCIQETWTNDFNRFNIPGYLVFNSARSTGLRGGTAIYIKSHIFGTQIIDQRLFIDNIIETTAVKIDMNGFKAIVCSLYRPNCHNEMNNAEQINSFMTAFIAILEFFDTLKLPVIILGDFNLNLFFLNDINSSATTLMDTISSFGYVQTISKATRLTEISATLIDNCFIKGLIPNVLFSGVITSDISDHFSTCITLKTNKIKKKRTVHHKKRLINQTTKQSFLDSLLALGWDEVLNADNVDTAYNNFFQTFMLYYNLNFPLVTHHNNKDQIPKQPFMSKNLLRCRAVKENLARISKTDPSPSNTNKYKSYRNVYGKTIRTAKKIHVRSQLAKANGNPKKIWSILKETLNVPPKNNNVSKLIIGDISITDNTLIADVFNDYFSNIGPSLADSLPATEHHFSEYLPPPCEASFFMEPINEQTMMNYILSIKPKLGTDDNDISMRTLHDVAKAIAKPLTFIFNLSVETGVFPDQMKISRGIPIHKKGSPFSLDNYRIVAMINSFSKIFEKIGSDRLTNFYEENNFFIDSQFGFRKRTSCTHALGSIINEITKKMNEDKHVLALFLDIQKCFDTVNRTILFRKLENSGVRGHILNWFKSYFSNRKQRVYVNSTNSSMLCDLTLGILQGSILGVLFFLVFINDIPFACQMLRSFLFADDNTCLLSCNSLQELLELGNSELDKLLQWYSANQLVIHPAKTKAFIFRPPRTNLNLNVDENGRTFLPLFLNMNNPNESNISKIIPINLIPNPEESSARLLGVLIDEKLNFKDHFNFMHGKVSKAVFSLKIMKNILDKRHLKLLYNSYLRSALDYGSALFTTASKSTIKPITILQKKAIRIICGEGYRAHTASLFKDEKLLRFEDIMFFNACRFMFDYKNGGLPKIFDGTWLRNDQVHNYPLRNASDFYIENVNKPFLKQFPLYQFPILWNSLPDNLKQINSRKLFAKELYAHLIDLIEVD